MYLCWTNWLYNMKIWSKGFDNAPEIDAFTVGKDRELDLMLAPWDILGTMAHITMLSEVGLLGKDDLAVLLPELKKLHQEAVEGRFTIEGEDVHSEVEARLIATLGDVGKKVHTGRSRNDQVAVDIKLFTPRLEKTVGKVAALFKLLQEKSEELKDVLMPGYTHLQVAMPSSFGLWLGAYAESLADDLVMLKAAWDVTDENPLGSAAGYGSSAPLNRARTTELLGFETLDYNSIYAQMSRGRGERMVAQAYGAVAETIGRLAVDGCLFTSQNFGFIHLPDAFTTGSSIMPQKKNPDVFELVRGHCNRIQGIPAMLRHITGNLPSGYFRDMQLLPGHPVLRPPGHHRDGRAHGQAPVCAGLLRGGGEPPRGGRRPLPRRLPPGGPRRAGRHLPLRRGRTPPHARRFHRQPVHRRGPGEVPGPARRVPVRPCKPSR